MRTRQEIEAKLAEIEATDTGKGLSNQNQVYAATLDEALTFVDSQSLEYGWLATATAWANGDTPNLRIETE